MDERSATPAPASHGDSADDPISVDLQQDCIRVARALVAQQGVEHLSVREVARELGVQPQAVAREYPTRDHLLVEVIRAHLRDFAEDLEAEPRVADPWMDFAEMGRRYMTFAMQRPQDYRLMFVTPWPAVAQERGLAQDGLRAFEVLRQALLRAHGSRSLAPGQENMDALFIWSCVHGLSMLSQSGVMPHLPVQPQDHARMVLHVLQRIGAAMLAPLGAAG